jgi:hypothetical protein
MKSFFLIVSFFAFTFAGTPEEITPDVPFEGEINPNTEIDIYLFPAVTGDKISIRMKPNVSCYHRLELVDPNDSIIASHDVGSIGLNAIEDFLIPATGTYRIRIREYSGTYTFKYVLELFSWRNTVATADTVHFGTEVTDSINPTIDMDSYLFSGASGDKVCIRMKPYVSCYHRLELINPDDSIIASHDVGSIGLNAIEDFLLPTTGTYRIRIREYSGSYNFKYTLGLYSWKHAIANAETIHFGTEVTDSIQPTIDMDSYLFPSVLGDKISIRMKPDASCYHRLELINPNDSIVASHDVGSIGLNAIEDFSITATGIYRIRIREYSGSYNFKYTLGLYPLSLMHDVSVIAISSPDSIVSSNTSITPKVIVYNGGKSTDDIPLHLIIGDQYYDSLTIDSLLPFSKDTIEFKPWKTPNSGLFTVICSTSLAFDYNRINNKASKTVKVDNSTGIAEKINVLPENYFIISKRLSGNGKTAMIYFSVPPTGRMESEMAGLQRNVSITMYNAHGQILQTLFDKTVAAGSYSVSFDGKINRGCSVGSNIYFCRMKSVGFDKTIKLLMY